MKTATNIYKLIVNLYPHSYREMFGEEMVQTFVDHYRDVTASSRRADLEFWLLIVADELQNIVGQHALELRENPGQRSIGIIPLTLAMMLLMPLFAICYAALVSLALALPLPAVSGIGFVMAMAALVLLAGALALVAGYGLLRLLRILPKRNLSIS